MNRLVVVVPTLLVATAAGVGAQGTQDGTIRGRVIDQRGLPIPLVTVTITSPQMLGDRTTVSDTTGSFTFHQVPAGIYDIGCERMGFAPVRQVTTVPLGGVVEWTATLVVGLSQDVLVLADVSASTSMAAAGVDVLQDEVESLATARTLQGIATLAPNLSDHTPNEHQVAINGAFAFDNVFMVNGVDVNDNLFGSPQNLFVEDAIAETLVLTSGIGAEYGRFTGGVVHAITKSGGNDYAGSIRVNLDNPAWNARTPFERRLAVEHQSNLNAFYEGTFGGPIATDRLWFFGAARYTPTETTRSVLPDTGLPYDRQLGNHRHELKLTGAVGDSHAVHGGYLGSQTVQRGRPTLPFANDLFALDDRRLPNWYGVLNHRGAVGGALVEAQYSERRFRFDDSGGDDPSILESPFLTLTQQLALYNGKYFDAMDPEERNNRQLTGSVTVFLGARGQHDVKVGGELFRSQLVGGNSQSASGYVFNADYARNSGGAIVHDSNGHLIPVFVPGRTFLEYYLPVRGARLTVRHTSLYARDRWVAGRRWSVDAGVRGEFVRSEASGRIVGVDTTTWVPRVAMSYDVTGDGQYRIGATYGHYAGRYNEAQIGVNSNVGNPDFTLARYVGPPGQGRSFAPGFDPRNYTVFFGRFPSANVFIEEGLSSPVVRELTASLAFRTGARGYGTVSYVYRDWTGFIEDFVGLQNGTTTVARNGVDFGTFTNIVYRNTDLADRTYQSVVLEGRYRLGNDWTANGSWTMQLQNDGNHEGEWPDRPAVVGALGNYPEAFDERNFPVGRLEGAQRHRVALWTIYQRGMGALGQVTVSGLWRVESGEAYAHRATNVALSEAQRALVAAYPDPPTSQTLFFGARGTRSFRGFGLLDASASYILPEWRAVRPWVKLDFFNVLNNLKQIRWNTTVLPDPAGPIDSLGRSRIEQKAPTYGEATSNAHYPGSQAGSDGQVLRGFVFRVSLGIRF